MMSRVLAVGFGPVPGAGPSSAQAAIETLATDAWAPADAQLDTMVLPWLWWPPFDVVAAAGASDALVLVSCNGGEDAVRVSGRALNRADSRLRDAAGYGWAGGSLAPGGAPFRESVLAMEALARAIGFAGIECRLQTKAARHVDIGVANRAFYEILAVQPCAAHIDLPLSIETARGLGRAARYNRYELLRGVQAAIGYVAAAATMLRGAA